MTYTKKEKSRREALIRSEVEALITKFNFQFNTNIDPGVKVIFRNMGQRLGECCISVSCVADNVNSLYNVSLSFNHMGVKLYFDDMINRTVPHEVAHYVVANIGTMDDIRYGHGKLWQSIMRSVFHVRPDVCYKTVPGLYNSYEWYCTCRKHYLGVRKHKNLSRKRNQGQGFSCKTCGGEVKPSGLYFAKGDMKGVRYDN